MVNHCTPRWHYFTRMQQASCNHTHQISGVGRTNLSRHDALMPSTRSTLARAKLAALMRLPHDVLTSIITEGHSAHLLIRMLQVCKVWRTPLLAHIDSLWCVAKQSNWRALHHAASASHRAAFANVP